METRTIHVSEELAGYDGWAGLCTVLKIERETWGRDRELPTKEVAFAISSLSLKRCSPAVFLKLWREHWHIENRLHWVLDMTMGEDACTVRKGAAPMVLHALRKMSLGLLRRSGASHVIAAIRQNSVHTD